MISRHQLTKDVSMLSVERFLTTDLFAFLLILCHFSPSKLFC